MKKQMIQVLKNHAVANIHLHKTNVDVYFDINESLKTIKVVKPSLMGTLVSSYRKTIRE